MLSGILRLANGLERGHRQNVLTVVSRIEPEQVVLTVKTRFEPDIEFWAADTLKLWLEEVLMTSVVIELQGRHG